MAKYPLKKGVQTPVVGMGSFELKTADVTLTAGQAKNLRATPITIVPAPPAGKAILPIAGAVYMKYAAVFASVTNNLSLVEGANQVSDVVTSTGFLDQTADQTRSIAFVKDAILTPNTAVQLKNIGGAELTGTGSPVRVKLLYAIVNL